MRKILKKEFYNRPALVVARELLGKFLVRQLGSKTVALMITEVEAYDGPEDKASHASRGKTERNKIMFGEAGNWYIYFTYGMHWMLNAVTGPENYPAAVLIRRAIFAPQPSSKVKYSNILKNIRILKIIDGPARLTKFLKIDKKFNGKPADKKTGLWIEDRGIKISPARIKRGKRIGVDYAGNWANKPYRFILKINREKLF